MDLIVTGAIVAAVAAFLGGDDDSDQGDGDGDGDGDADNKWSTEPDDGPGPIIRPMPIDPDAGEHAIKVAELIRDPPQERTFYQIYKGGPSASAIAGAVLGKHGLDTGQNRARLIRCWTQIAWNRNRYASTRSAQGWKSWHDVDGENISAAWLPRNAGAPAMLAQKVRPPRTIHPDGSWMGEGTSYGLIWIGEILSDDGEFICNPDERPPSWLLESIEGT